MKGILQANIALAGVLIAIGVNLLTLNIICANKYKKSRTK